MKNKLILFICIANLLFVSSLFSQEMKGQDALELLTDKEWSLESQSLSRILQDGMSVIQYQNQQQQEINNLVLSYLETDQITLDELWEGLDDILIQMDMYSGKLNDQVNNLKINTSSSNPNARKVYKDFLGLIYDLNDYSMENNKLTKDLIGHLSEGEVEQYDYKFSRSYLRNADFLELMAKTNRANASIFPSWNINRSTLMLDSQVIEYMAIATRVNGYQMMGELNESLLKTYKEQLDTSYQEIQKGELYEGLMFSINYLNAIKKEIQSMNIDALDLIDVLNELTINAKLYSDANLRQADLWKEIMDFYIRNSDYLNDLFTDSTRNAEFTELQARQEFEMTQVSKYSVKYTQAAIKFAQIFPEYADKLD